MRSFWGYTENENFKVGCTGQTTYVYDKNDNELARFKKDILYGYLPMFKPNSNILVVKSNEGRLAIYNLNTLSLVKKFRYTSVVGGCDNSMCFSKDGKLFYNIESHIECYTRLTVYDAETFEPKKRLFEETEDEQILDHIECDKENGNIYMLGFIRGVDREFHKPFVAQLKNDKLINKTNISYSEYEYLESYKDIEIHGFTQKTQDWSSLKYEGYDLTDIEKKNFRLADYIK
jgi:WD40 repeat protein